LSNVPPLRIGHAVAFRHFLDPAEQSEKDWLAPTGPGTSARRRMLARIGYALLRIRDWQIPIEINLTANHILCEFEPTFHFKLLNEGFLLVLSTDNHGVWNCSQELQPDGKTFAFSAIAGEFVTAVKTLRNPESKEMLTGRDILRLVTSGLQARFDQRRDFSTQLAEKLALLVDRAIRRREKLESHQQSLAEELKKLTKK